MTNLWSLQTMKAISMMYGTSSLSKSSMAPHTRNTMQISSVVTDIKLYKHNESDLFN